MGGIRFKQVDLLRKIKPSFQTLPFKIHLKATLKSLKPMIIRIATIFNVNRH